MRVHIGTALGQIAGKHIVGVREETIASVDSMPLHRVILRFEEGDELTIDLASMTSMSYTGVKARRKSSKRRSR